MIQCRQKVKEIIYSAALEFVWVGTVTYKGKGHKAWSTLRHALQDAVAANLIPQAGQGMLAGLLHCYIVALHHL
jgi:hypothetical protein